MIRIFNNKTGFKNTLIQFLWWTVGSMLFAAAINIFTAPNNITVGGFSGIGTLLNYLFSVPIGFCVFALNVPFFLIALKKFGLPFIIKTVIATLETSLFIDLSAPFIKSYSGDRLLSSVFGGVLLGVGLGLIFHNGATTGGSDIIAKLLRLKFAHLSMGRVIFAVDLIIVIGSAFAYKSVESMLYSLVTIFISTQAIDLVNSGFSHSKTVLIVTDKGDMLSEKILHHLDRGVTVIDAYGGYTKMQKQLLFCAVRASEVPQFSKLIRQEDEDSFMIVADADDILGRGFNKEYNN